MKDIANIVTAGGIFARTPAPSYASSSHRALIAARSAAALKFGRPCTFLRSDKVRRIPRKRPGTRTQYHLVAMARS